MRKFYYEEQLEIIVDEIKSYITNSSLDSAEKGAYLNELNENKRDFLGLVKSGVFHDACGNLISLSFSGASYCAEVETEY